MKSKFFSILILSSVALLSSTGAHANNLLADGSGTNYTISKKTPITLGPVVASNSDTTNGCNWNPTDSRSDLGTANEFILNCGNDRNIAYHIQFTKAPSNNYIHLFNTSG